VLRCGCGGDACLCVCVCCVCVCVRVCVCVCVRGWRQVTVMPRFCVVNCLDTDLILRQAGEQA
jgi:hypothetical protein